MMQNLNTNLSKINVEQNARAKRAEDEMEGMRRKFQDLAMKIFIRHPPVHNQQGKGQCPHCQVPPAQPRFIIHHRPATFCYYLWQQTPTHPEPSFTIQCHLPNKTCETKPIFTGHLISMV